MKILSFLFFTIGMIAYGYFVYDDLHKTEQIQSMYTHQQLEDSVQAAKDSYLDELEKDFVITPKDEFDNEEQQEPPMLGIGTIQLDTFALFHSQIKPEDTVK